jgi:hypothetical protein
MQYQSTADLYRGLHAYTAYYFTCSKVSSKVSSKGGIKGLRCSTPIRPTTLLEYRLLFTLLYFTLLRGTPIRLNAYFTTAEYLFYYLTFFHYY